MEGGDAGEDVMDRLSGRDVRQTLLFLSFEDGKEFPFAVTHVEIAEPDSAIREIESLGGPLTLIPAKEEVIFQFLFADRFRVFPAVSGQLPDSSRVGLLCSAALAVDLERADHFCVPIVVFFCHTVPPIQ